MAAIATLERFAMSKTRGRSKLEEILLHPPSFLPPPPSCESTILNSCQLELHSANGVQARPQWGRCLVKVPKCVKSLKPNTKTRLSLSLSLGPSDNSRQGQQETPPNCPGFWLDSTLIKSGSSNSGLPGWGKTLENPRIDTPSLCYIDSEMIVREIHIDQYRDHLDLSSSRIFTRISSNSSRLVEGCEKVRGPVEQTLK